jgi:hypothetical protein
MRTENEIVDSHIATRIVCGAFALAGLVAAAATIFKLASGTGARWPLVLLGVSSCYGIYLFGRYAWTGRFPFRFPSSDA